ncbi:NAD-dependent epimerase/dehydratase [Nonomuraea purpurea]|uniref:NAD-dependent epimerase/dehydratase n=1 Tax=Nonomuraea purpurea TaxID=1849276 RepID=A0ABV8GIE1_9ACTN
MTRPLITVLGASGFVGSAVLSALAERPVTVRAVARRPATVSWTGRADFETRAADLTVAGNLSAAVAGADAVVHLVLDTVGWRDADPLASARVNVGVMRDLLDCLRSSPRRGRPPVVAFAGSVSQVGPVLKMPIDGTEPDRPQTVYDRQKQSAENLLKQASGAGVVRGLSLRLPTVFGGGGDRGVLAAMARRALAGEPISMWHDGTVERDLLHVRDVADAFVAALDHADALTGRHWLLGRGRSTPIGEVFRMIAELASAHTGRPPVPVVSVPPPADAPGTDFAGVSVDASAFRSVTGWRPRLPLDEALTMMTRALAESAR